MKTYLSLVFVLALSLGASPNALSAQIWNVTDLKVEPGEEETVSEALAKLQKTAVAKNRRAAVQLQRYLFNGSNPATHSLVVLYPNRAENQKANQNFASTDDFEKWSEKMMDVAEIVYNGSNRTLKGWGTVSNDDRIWLGIYLNVKDPLGFLAAMAATTKSGAA